MIYIQSDKRTESSSKNGNDTLVSVRWLLSQDSLSFTEDAVQHIQPSMGFTCPFLLPDFWFPPPSLTPHPHTAGSHCKVFFEQVITLKLGRTLFFEFGWGGEAVPWQLGKSALHLSPSPWEDPFKVGKGAFMFQRQ